MATKTLTIETLRRCVAALNRGQVARVEPPVVLMHPQTHLDIRRADARAQWRQQHRANRIAQRTGVPAGQVARQFTAETREAFGVRIVVMEGGA